MSGWLCDNGVEYSLLVSHRTTSTNRYLCCYSPNDEVDHAFGGIAATCQHRHPRTSRGVARPTFCLPERSYSLHLYQNNACMMLVLTEEL